MLGNTIERVERVQEYLAEKDIHTVEIGFGDINGSIIGKRMPARYFGGHMLEGTGICRAPLTWDIQSEYFSESEFGGFVSGAADMILKPDLDTLRRIPWRTGAVFVVADLYFDWDEIIEQAPRQVLKNVLARLEKLGYRAKVGSEIEFYLLDEQKNPLFGGKECYSIGKVGEFSHIYDEIQENLEKFNIPIEGIHTEYGPGQSELILEYSDALTNADNTVIAKNAIKEIARKNGLYATFMALPWTEHSASGYHLHQSLWTEENENAFAAPPPYGETVLNQYVAGLLATTREFMALGNPTVNSYKRLTEMSFAPTKIGVGYDNRTVSARLFGHGDGLRVEQRTGSADANPYLLIASNIAGGLYGLEHKLPPPAIKEGNGYFDERLENVPRTLEKAAECFDGSEKANDYFGKAFTELFSDLIHYDISAHHNSVTDWERDRYLENS